MQIVSCLSLEVPFLTVEHFRKLCELIASGAQPKDLSEHFEAGSKIAVFLRENAEQAFERAQAVLDQLVDQNIEVLYPDHAKYPAGFFELEDPPLHLALEGNFDFKKSIAVVGSREPSRFAIEWLNEHLAEALKLKEFTVLSGGARGIDLTAHLTAAKVGRPTVVFVPAGLRQLYPRDLEKWKPVILESGGAFISEFPLNREMHRYHFVKRNRLIVGAADLVFVAEARRRSGSMLTANIARGMNKTICTLPTSPAMLSGQGSLDLIFDGAFPLRDYLDLLALLEISSRRVSE
jgi:DNA processing protein